MNMQRRPTAYLKDFGQGRAGSLPDLNMDLVKIGRAENFLIGKAHS
jgi:hypothetical protein